MVELTLSDQQKAYLPPRPHTKETEEQVDLLRERQEKMKAKMCESLKLLSDEADNARKALEEQMHFCKYTTPLLPFT